MKQTVKMIGMALTMCLLLAVLPMAAFAGKKDGKHLATPSDARTAAEAAAGERAASLTAKTATPSDAERDLEGNEDGAVLDDKAAPEKKDAEKLPEGNFLTAEDLAGTWTVDGVTNYRFEEGGAGTLLLPEHDYAFAYTLEENALTLEFESAGIKPAVFRVSLEGETLTLEREEEAGTAVFLLQRKDD